ncbi:MAG: TonB family protein [Candidatus Omnitrophica bacterium]|nr:TonB family protein [Candidatus Omnitrophota bacterium]MCK5492444.1 TonB family protein [Candidatus Omnitrophota bacterium]
MGPTSNLFKITFLFSLVVHAVFFLPLSKINKPKKEHTQQLKLSYIAQDVPAKKKIARFKHKKIKLKNKQLRADKKIIAKLTDNSGIKKQPIQKKFPQAIKKNESNGNTLVDLKKNKQISTVPGELVKKELSKNKSYISYYKLINEQLRQAVIYPAYFSEGEIGLSFILGSDGKLKDVKVIKTTAAGSEILKETAMQIVKKASPFPPFPKNLQQKQLTFNIVFCFKENS